MGDQRAIRIEGAAGQESSGRIALVKEVAQAREDLETLRDVIRALQIDHHIAWDPAPANDISSLAVGSARLIRVVLVAVQIRASCCNQIAADVPLRRNRIVRNKPAGMLWNQRTPVALLPQE